MQVHRRSAASGLGTEIPANQRWDTACSHRWRPSHLQSSTTSRPNVALVLRTSMVGLRARELNAIGVGGEQVCVSETRTSSPRGRSQDRCATNETLCPATWLSQQSAARGATLPLRRGASTQNVNSPSSPDANKGVSAFVSIGLCYSAVMPASLVTLVHFAISV